MFSFFYYNENTCTILALQKSNCFILLYSPFSFRRMFLQPTWGLFYPQMIPLSEMILPLVLIHSRSPLSPTDYFRRLMGRRGLSILGLRAVSFFYECFSDKITFPSRLVTSYLLIDFLVTPLYHL